MDFFLRTEEMGTIGIQRRESEEESREYKKKSEEKRLAVREGGKSVIMR